MASSESVAEVNPTQLAGDGAYRFAAFISYRHTPTDRAWAVWLHGALERYRLPKGLADRLGVPDRIGRVFRDEEELSASSDLSASIQDALAASKFLIVICSPRTPGSRWVNQEIERFRAMGRHDRILAVLIEGDTATAFPASLTGLSAEGSYARFEPLAADVRKSGDARGHQLKRLAKFRLLAPMLGVDFDDLRRRDAERRHRRMLWAGAGLAALCVAFGFLAALAWSQRNSAITSARLAASRETEARQSAADAELRLANALVAQADAMSLAGRADAARSRCLEADEIYRRLGKSPLEAELAVWSANERSPAPLLTFAGEPSDALAIAFTPDGLELLEADRSGVVTRWDARTGLKVSGAAVSTGGATAAVFSSDLKRAAFGQSNGSVIVWDVLAGRPIADFTTGSSPVGALAFMPDGSGLLVGGDDLQLKLFDIGRRTLDRVIGSDRYPVCSIAVSPDGRNAVTGSYTWHFNKGQLRLWDLGGGAPSKTLLEESAGILRVAYSPDGRTVASAGYDGTVAVWDSGTGNPLNSFAGHTDHVRGLAYVEGCVASGGDDGRIQLDNVRTGQTVRTYREDPSSTRLLAYCPATHLLASAGRHIVLWNTGIGREKQTFAEGEHYAAAVILPDPRWGITASNGLTFWDLAGGISFLQIVDPTDRGVPNPTGGPGLVSSHAIGSLACSPDGTSLIWCEYSGSVSVLSLESPPKLNSLRLGADPLQKVVLAPTGRGAIVVTNKGELIFLSAPELKQTDRWEARAFSAAFLPNGRGVLCGGTDGQLALRAIPDGRVVWTVPAHRGTVMTVAVSGDGKWVLSGGGDGTVRLSDVEDGRLIREFVGHGRMITEVAFWPDGYHASTTSRDGTCRVWDVNDGRELRSIPIPTTVGMDDFGPVAFSGDRRLLLSGAMAQLTDLRCGREYLDEVRAVPEAQRVLSASPNDARSLRTLGKWYALRGVDAWGVDLLTRARAAGAEVDSAELMACELAAGRPIDAAREYRRQLAQASGKPFRVMYEWAAQRAALRAEPALRETAVERAGKANFAESVALFDEAIEMNPDDLWTWFYKGAILAYSGPRDAYVEHCRKMTARFDVAAATDPLTADRVSKTALLLAGAIEPAHALEMAEFALSRAGDDADRKTWFQLGKSLALYRCGDYRACIDCAARCEREQRSESPMRTATLRSLTALAHARLGEFGAAQTALRAAGELIHTDLPVAGRDDLRAGDGVESWCVCQTLYREARGLIEPATK